MGSTTPPKNPNDQKRQQPPPHQQNLDVSGDLSYHELTQLLERRDQEICRLRHELEKYKSALRSLRLYTHSEEAERLACADDIVDDALGSLLCSATSVGSPMPSGVSEKGVQSETILPDVSSQMREPSASGEVVFKTEADEDKGDEKEMEMATSDRETTLQLCASEMAQFKDEDINMTTEIQEIIQDIEDIDLDLELNKNRKKRRKPRKEAADLIDRDEIQCDNNDGQKQHDDNGSEESNAEEKDDIITDGLLTSLTDAAISNLSQLAALQERCESQQQHSQQPKSLQEQYQAAKQNRSHPVSSVFSCHSERVVRTASSDPVSTPKTTLSSTCAESQQGRTGGYKIQESFLATNFAKHAAMARNANNSQSTSLTHPMNVNSSVSSTIQASQDLSSDQSLASVVAAAAAAAAEAAAVGDHQRHHQQATLKQHQIPINQQLHSQQQSRLISSAITSPDIYQHLHQRQLNLTHQISPISSLHFSPSITSPSPSSLIGGPSHQSRQSGSTASSSLLSPIASPGYLRRQFMTDGGGLPMMSPSPTTSLVTVGSSSGIGSGASSAHILQMAQQHQQQLHHPHSQQRSASALAGHISSGASSNVSLGGATSSSVVNPMMTSKNSSQARLNNMQIRHKFGYLGSGRGQFNSPHGFCLGLNQEIVVADTNNHRICIFDKDGTYITQFGSPGKEEGQLWNPRKVAILHKPISGCGASSNSDGGTSSLVHHQRIGPSSASTFSSNFTSGGGIQSAGRTSGGNHFASEPLYVVCDRGAERSRMQLFTKDGAFIKKIGIHYIDIVAGLAITQDGLIIVVDSVSPTVYIINAQTGTLNGWFDCSGHMKEPSDIAVKSDIPGNEYFICDFKGHCVVVFSEQGDYLRKIGHDGLTSYPNGIDISDDGDILVGDSHGNRFHVVVFDRNGNFVSQFECPHVKVSRCCGLKITREGYIVTLAKNNHHVLVLDTIHI